MTSNTISQQITEYYLQHLEEHGFSAKGVGWKNETAQQERFRQVLKIVDQPTFSINDLGFGTGAFYDFLVSEGYDSFTYRGYDTLDIMVKHVLETHGHLANASFKKICEPREMKTADYTVASGIFSLKFDVPDEEWLKTMLDTLEVMSEKSTRGFAFNLLTKYSDPEKLDPNLYYADPLFIFDHCMRHFSRKVALLHDYEQYDFTILVKK